MIKHTKLALMISALFATSLSTAWAQSAPATADGTTASPAKKAEQLETVVVTAQKRKEDASKVPLSISVMSGDQLEAAHITDMADVTRAVPNISFSGQGGAAGPGLSNIEMRGISSAAGSGTVGIYLDDVSMTTRNLYSLGSAEPKFFDISRIEVLRGPQGTLYGASSMGGTIKFITNQPELDGREINVHAEVSGTEHGGINTLTNAVINQPLIPGELALRVGVQSGRTSGYIDQVSATDGHTIASRINSEEDRVVRLALKWQPTHNLSITPALFYQEVATNDIDATYLSLPANQVSKTVREPGVDRLSVPSVTVNYDLGSADLISVTSYYNRTFNRTQDGTAVNSQYIGSVINGTSGVPAGLGDAVSLLPSAVYLNNSVRQVSQEVRIASKPYDPKVSPITWLAGGYFSNLHTSVFDNEPVFGINSTFSQFGTDTTTVLGFPFPNDNSYYSVRHYETKQYAGFGELNYYFNPALHATLGLRYLHAKDALKRDGDLYFANGTVHTFASSKADAVTPKIAVSWDVDPTDMVYASASKGVRLGSENRDIPYSVCAPDFNGLGLTGSPASFGPDKLWSYEAGNKSRFLNNHLSVNFAAFYITWDQIQQDITLPTCGYDFETNIGKARSYGAEVEVKAKPMADVIVGFSGGYTHAELSSDVASLGVKSGDPIEGVPEFNASLNAEYHFALPSDADGFVRGASHWVGKSHGSLVKSDPDYDRPAYFTFDASAGFTLNTWEISIFAKNLFNNDKIIQRPNVQFVSEGYRVRPRTIGFSLSGKL